MTPQKLAEKYRKLIKERMPLITTAHDEKSHFYVYNGNKYPSVTKKLQMLKDEGLMNWKMNRALDRFVELLKDPAYQGKEYSELVEEAKLAPVKEFEGAGSIGTAVHNWREEWFTSWMERGSLGIYPIPVNSPREVMSACRAIKTFVQDTGYIPVACEMYLADEKLGIGGTLDDFGILHGKPTLIDLKTSNIGDKTSYFLQVALYYYMFKKLTGINIKEFYILHVSKTDGTYKLIPIKNMKELIKDAHILLKLHASLERIVEEKKKEVKVV